VTLFKTRLQRAPLIAILRGVVSDEVEAIGAVLIESGFEIIEVPLNSPAPSPASKNSHAHWATLH